MTVGDRSSPASKRARSERLMCAMHVVAALASRPEGGTRFEAVLVRDLVSDLQQIIGRHMFVSVSVWWGCDRHMFVINRHMFVSVGVWWGCDRHMFVIGRHIFFSVSLWGCDEEWTGSKM